MIVASALVAAALILVQNEGGAAAPRTAPPALRADADASSSLTERGVAALTRLRADGFVAARADLTDFVNAVMGSHVGDGTKVEAGLADVLDAALEAQLTQDATLQDHELMTSTAIALALVGEGDRGVARLEAAVASPTATFASLLAAGHVCIARDDVVRALTLYERASVLRPESALPWHDRGAALGRMGRFTEALDAFDHALQLDPQSAGAQFNRAIVLEKLQRPDEALDAYRTLADGASTYAPRAALNLGTILIRRGDRDGARTAYERCVALDPASASGHHNLGALLVELGEDAAAISHLERAAELRRDDPRPHALLGQIADDAGDTAAAEKHLRAALERDPRFPSARYRLAQLLRRSGRIDDAKEFEDSP